jgi:hypothetical protein
LSFQSPAVPVLRKRAITWLPEEQGFPKAVLREARKSASEICFSTGRRDSVARYLAALAAVRAGRLSLVGDSPLFQAPGIVVADPQKEAFYWSLNPGVPLDFEERETERLAAMLMAQQDQRTPAAVGN